MRRSSAAEEDAFLHAEARELAVLAEECIGRRADRRQPGSVLHTLGVELSVLMGLADPERLDWLVAEAARLLMQDGKPEACSALQATLSRLRDTPGPLYGSVPHRGPVPVIRRQDTVRGLATGE